MKLYFKLIISCLSLLSCAMQAHAIGEGVDDPDRTYTEAGTITGWQVVEDSTATGGTAARSPGVRNSETTWIEAPITGPATVTFRSRISGNSYPRPSINYKLAGQTQWQSGYNLPTSTAWTDNVVVVPSGDIVLRWYLTSYGSSSGTADHLWIDDVNVASLEPVPLAEALDLPDTVTVTTNGGWSGIRAMSADGEDAAILLGGTSSYQTMNFSVTGPAEVSFKTTGRSYSNLSLMVTPKNSQSYQLNWFASNTEFLATTLQVGPGQNQIELKGLLYSSDLISYIVVDEFQVIPLEIGDVKDALDTELEFRQGIGVWRKDTEETTDGEDSLMAGPATSGASEIETTINGPTILSFNWLAETVNSAQGRLYLYLKTDDNQRTLLLQNESYGRWKNEEVVIPPGEHVLLFRFETYNYYSSSNIGGVRAWLDQVVTTPLQNISVNQALDTDAVAFHPARNGWVSISGGSASDGEDALQFSNVNADVDPLMTVVNGPAKVRFSWDNPSVLSFQIGEPRRFDGVWADISTSSSGWATVEQVVSPGQHAIRWLPRSSGSSYRSAKLDRLTIEPLPLVSLPEALDAVSLPWFTGPEGNEWWGQTVETFDLSDAAQSATLIGQEYSYIETIVDGPGALTFRWKRSTSGSSWSTTYQFYVAEYWPNTNLLDWQVSANTIQTNNWESVSYNVPPGRHLLAWSLANTGSGVNSALLDSVRFVESPSSTVFRASIAQDGWKHSPWFGWYTDNEYPWIYSYAHGWQYATGTNDRDIALYDTATGRWYWTGEGAYPAVYSFEDEEWYLIVPGTQPGGRWLYRYSDGAWTHEQEL